MLDQYLPNVVNTGRWIPAYTLEHLRSLPADTEFVLPVCSLATPYAQCHELGQYLLPPLFHEALDTDLKQKIVSRIQYCFPGYADGRQRNHGTSRVRVVDLPQSRLPDRNPANVVAFSVDTAVEEHGPHLPLGTDTIQSYAVLSKVAQDISEVELVRPLEYGQLTWGLPFGFSIDLTAELLTQYVQRFTQATIDWLRPQAVYVVDVHGSIVHRQAIVDGLKSCSLPNCFFRWLHEPLAEFASARGDQHAGGVETALVELTNPQLVDPAWWPHRQDELAARQMRFETAVELSNDLDKFVAEVKRRSFNGIVGDIRNYDLLDSQLMFDRMVQIASADINRLLNHDPEAQTAGQRLW